MKKMICAALLALAATPASAGERMLTPEEKAGITAFVGKSLKDPSSAQYVWGPVKDGKVYCGFVNAKNSYGGYTGYQLFMVNIAPLAQGETVFKATPTRYSVGGTGDETLIKYLYRPTCVQLGYPIEQ